MPELSALPRAARYLRALPDGLDSYPEIQLKGSTARAVIENLPSHANINDVPEEVRWMLTNPPPVSGWFPEVHMITLVHVMRDLWFTSEEQQLEWVHDNIKNLFGGSLYKVLFGLISPMRLAKSSKRAWASLRRGSEREILEMSDNHNLGRVIYPQNCYDSFYMEVIALALKVAYGMSRAKAPRVRILSCSPTVSEIEVVYDVTKLEGGELPRASGA